MKINHIHLCRGQIVKTCKILHTHALYLPIQCVPFTAIRFSFRSDSTTLKVCLNFLNASQVATGFAKGSEIFSKYMSRKYSRNE